MPGCRSVRHLRDLQRHADLALSLDVSDQLRLLKSLGHWVGDVHQPLHVSFDDDRGGNLVAIAGPRTKANLHSVGTGASSRRRSGSITRILPQSSAPRLRTKIGRAGSARGWSSRAVVSWANESSAIAERPDVQYCVQKNDACWYAPTCLNIEAGLKELSRSMTPI